MWKYKNKLVHGIADIPKKFEDCDHIIYEITNKTNGKKYIGKKILYNNKKVILSKKKQTELKTRRKSIRTRVESDWMKYWGSSKELLDDIKILGPDKFEREILEFVKTKKKATYKELVYMIKRDVLRSDLFYNSNILGRFFPKDVI